MKIILLFAFFQINILLNHAAVYQTPNPDDKQYWHEYNINYLKNILKSQKPTKVAKNVILFVGDGMSFATIAAGRILKGQMQGKSGEETQVNFETFPHIGLSKTYNTNSQVPDSAATATAIFSGIKTTIRTIGLNNPTPNAKESERLKTIIDWAQEKGKRTGLVTNTRICHATPASAYAYSFHRDYECDTKVPNYIRSHFKDISRQLVENKPGKDLNVIFGGGKDFLGAHDIFEKNIVQFAGAGEVSCNRTDKQNLVEKYLRQFNNETVVKYVTNTGEMLGIDYDNVDHVLGLFANNHMEYESLRNKNSDGQPSLTEMTKAAIRILNNKKNKNGYVLIVEGGKIDQAHHQNHARLALEEFVEFERAIQQAKDMTSSDETLIIVTADHAHSMIFNGYGKRGNDILGFGNTKKVNSQLYETIVYATGPGYLYHTKNDTDPTISHMIPLEEYTEEQRGDALYMHQSMIPMYDSVHGGEDVGVFSDGPGSFLLQRTFEQCYIAYAISFASCIGPAADMNELCKSKPERLTSDSSSLKTSIGLTFLSVLFCSFKFIASF
ncbi:hypothetical protein PVAND_003084 [Polypedilum vanderplanki]|uniref:Alkaline phosphatase n=1 Tax=Polypedilum vanderplanki TaxID=319348 RepID=A0A9J6BT03_POLVA|nr:hypothetical protein PVAND_003084 [Polypedilum vanderplanki]